MSYKRRTPEEPENEQDEEEEQQNQRPHSARDGLAPGLELPRPFREQRPQHRHKVAANVLVPGTSTPGMGVFGRVFSSLVRRAACHLSFLAALTYRQLEVA